ncbi:MAG TPA: DUF4150 domain-containing protein [Ideonella sp.]|uniref:DUF4150 domain-containing protein n=1 Tax=Ideonella sp. TaxID=1929293 RepID=UPI002BFBBE78|nr:DUF4150 domain-containing protein [Ideonella sp.]HSI49048.1 DUF4150 domain-containing protein [Ideonella sp.]
MSLTIKINGDDNSLAHKGCSGFAKSTLPDVCKTPSPAGPVPIPYPIILSMASDLANGTTTVKADGGNMCAIKGSELSRCSGDEPGTAGGVKSSTNMKESTWILYAFTVKMEGKNACRLGDKLFMNHENTACLGGWMALPVIPQNLTAEQAVACAIMCCDKMPYRQTRGKSSKNDCQRLATKKHSCVHHSLTMLNKSTKAEGNTQSGGDIVSAPRFKEKGSPYHAPASTLAQAKALRGPAFLKKNKEVNFLSPDVLIRSDPPKIIDAKFIPCASRDEIKKNLRPDGRIVMNGHTLETAAAAGPISGKKEQQLYRQLTVDGKQIDPGRNGVKTMTPENAKNALEPNPGCDCSKTAPGTKENLPY